MNNRIRSGTGGGVAIAGLAVLLLIVGVGILSLPDGDDANKAQQIVAIVTAAFGVIGAIVGAYFGVSSSNEARREAERRLADQGDGGE